jgi:hypothetical protein
MEAPAAFATNAASDPSPKSAQDFTLSALPGNHYGKLTMCRQFSNEPHHQPLCRLCIEDAFLFRRIWEDCDEYVRLWKAS